MVKMEIGIDKFYHISVAFGLTFLLSILFMILNLSSIISILVVFLLLVGKEIYDIKKENATGFSISDMIFNIIGILTGYISFVIVMGL